MEETRPRFLSSFPPLFSDDRGYELEEIPDRAVLDTFVPGQGNGIRVYVGKKGKRRKTIVMTVEIVEIPDGKTLELRQNILPVDKGMVQLDKQIFETPQDTVVPLHDLHQDPVLLGYLDGRPRPLEIDLQCRGFKCSVCVFHER